LDQANDLIEKGTRELEEGNLEGAKKAYLESIGIKETSGAWFNLGVSRVPRSSHRASTIGFMKWNEMRWSTDEQVCEYHLSELILSSVHGVPSMLRAERLITNNNRK
jgi:hypothetical protein